eukprot:scaffold199494_cov10-Tisochrysis_lutea.AAC.1
MSHVPEPTADDDDDDEVDEDATAAANAAGAAAGAAAAKEGDGIVNLHPIQDDGNDDGSYEASKQHRWELRRGSNDGGSGEDE